MSALTSYTAANRVIDSGLVITYDWSLVFGSWTGTSVVASAASVTYTQMYQYRRRARAAYRYVGMDAATAQNCYAAMKAKYKSNSAHTKHVQNWEPTSGGMGDWCLQRIDGVDLAKVEKVYDGGGLYSVHITIDEEYLYMSKSAQSSNPLRDITRDYDGLE